MQRRLLAAIAAGIAVRAILIYVAGPKSLPVAQNDHIVYFLAAEKLATSSDAWVQPIGEFGYRAPLYFVYLAMLFGIHPALDYRGAQLCSSLLGIATAVLLYVIGRRIGGPEVGWWSLCLRLFTPSFVIADTFVMSETLYSVAWATAVLGFLILYERPDSLRGTIPLGIGISLAMLTRESALFLPVVFLVGTILIGGPISARVARFGGTLVVLLATLMPWMLRNHYVWGSPMPIAHTAGVNLYVGNNPQATGTWGVFTPIAPPGVRIGTPEASRWYRDAAWDYIRRNPATFLENGLKKLAWLAFPAFQRDEMSSVYTFSGRTIQWLSIISGASSALVLLFGVYALIAQRASAPWRLLVVLVAYQVGLALVAFGSPRFRDTIDHVLILAIATQMCAFCAKATEVRRDDRGPTVGWRRRLSLFKIDSAAGRSMAVVLAWLAVLSLWAYIAVLKITLRG